MGSQGSEALTLEAFLALCEAAPEGVRYEAVGGRAMMMSSPSGRHQLVQGRLYTLLQSGLPGHMVALTAPFDWVLWQVPALTVRQPDVLVMTVDQLDEHPLTSPPVLVAELLSPTTRLTDVRDKRREYARAGAEHYWVVDLETPSIEAFVLDAATGRYRAATAAAGDDVLSVTEPFPVAVSPADLMRKGGGPWAPMASGG